MQGADGRISRVQRGRRVEIEVDGQKVAAYEGETVAGALLANHCRVLRRTQKLHMPRGIFCGIGVCHDCLMVVNGVPKHTCLHYSCGTRDEN